MTSTDFHAEPSEGPEGEPALKRPRPASRKYRGLRLFLRDVAIIVVSAIVISFLIKTFLIRSFYIPSPSMEMTLVNNDRIIVNQLVPRLFPIERGDVLVFSDPGGWLEYTPEPEKSPMEAGLDWFLQLVGLSVSDSNNHLIKRVIGVGGDRVVCCDDDGRLSINGVGIDEWDYIEVPSSNSAASGMEFDVTVPEGHLWMMGDNRYNSTDSRAHIGSGTGGFVPVENVVGKAFVISWPTARWGWLGNHPEVFDVVDEQLEDPAGASAE